jgi:hypothetical protein
MQNSTCAYWNFNYFKSNTTIKLITPPATLPWKLFVQLEINRTKLSQKPYKTVLEILRQFTLRFRVVWKNYLKIYIWRQNYFSQLFFTFKIFSIQILKNLYTFIFFSQQSLRLCVINSVAHNNELIYQQNRHYFLLNFRRNNTFFANLCLHAISYNKTLNFTSPGMFIKFFQNKKSFKKHKLTKLLTLKFFRKIFLIARLRTLILAVKKLPSLLPELLKYFQQPLYMKYKKTRSYLTTEDFIFDKKTPKTEFRPPLFSHYYFIDTKTYSKQKTRKKGRIKRKITRKLIASQHIID